MLTKQDLLGRCAQLHCAQTIGRIAADSLELIAETTRCDSAIFALTDNTRGRCAGAFWPDDCGVPALMPAYERFWHENPIGHHHTVTGEDRATRLDDVIDRSSLVKLGYYNEYLRPARITDVMTGYMSRRGRYRLALTAMRSGGAFSNAERDAMERIRAHSVAAFWNFTRIAELTGSPVGVQDLLGSGLHTAMVIVDDANDPPPPKPRRIQPLTPAERRILRWMCEGKSNPEIAIIAGCSVRTVHKHVEHILQKLCVENRTSAVIRAIAMRLLD